MAADNLIGNMFGVDPNQLAMKRYAEQQADALQYAQLDPFQRASMSMYQGGANLVNAGAGMMGLKTPEQTQAESRHSIMSSVDTSTPDGLLKGAQLALQQGNPMLAGELNRAAQVLASEKSKIEYERAKTAREEAMAEKLARGDNEKLTQAGTANGVPVYYDSKGQYTFENGQRVPFTGKLDMASDGGGGSGRPHIVTDAAGNITVLSPDATRVVAKYDRMGKPTATHEKDENAKSKMIKDIDHLIPQLEQITAKGGLIDQSTGSGMGAVTDIAAGALGYETKGARAIAELKPIADLVLKLVPRFEGPQSNADTASYQAAAGDLADPTKPPGIRKAAAKIIMKLYRERRDQFGVKASEMPSDIKDILNKYNKKGK